MHGLESVLRVGQSVVAASHGKGNRGTDLAAASLRLTLVCSTIAPKTRLGPPDAAALPVVLKYLRV